jgi:hypothetical protein
MTATAGLIAPFGWRAAFLIPIMAGWWGGRIHPRLRPRLITGAVFLSLRRRLAPAE